MRTWRTPTVRSVALDALDESRRAMLATVYLPVFGLKAKERQADGGRRGSRSRLAGQVGPKVPKRRGRSAAADVAARVGVSERSMERAAFVQRTDPVLARMVLDGELNLVRAERQARGRATSADGAERIYFIRAGDLIKIGRSIDVQARLETLQTGSPVKLELLASFVPTSAARQESELHRRFAGSRVHGEWFSAEANLLRLIDQMAEPTEQPAENAEE